MTGDAAPEQSPAMKMSNRQRTGPSLVQRRDFVASCLPALVTLATQHRTLLEPLLVYAPAHWPLGDRVLWAVSPAFRADVEAFHEGTQPALTEQFDLYQLGRIDCACVWLLVETVESEHPELAAALREGIEER